MAVPAKPIRKAASVNMRPNGAVPGANKSNYNRKKATGADASKSTYSRKSSGIKP